MSAPARDFDVDYSERAGFLTGKSAAIADWHHRKDKQKFAKLVAVLRVRNWRLKSPDKAKTIAQRQAQREKQERAARAHDTKPITCAHCHTQWCRLNRRHWAKPGPQFCTPEHARRHAYEQKKLDPTWVAANIARATQWQKTHAARRRETHAKRRADLQTPDRE